MHLRRGDRSVTCSSLSSDSKRLQPVASLALHVASTAPCTVVQRTAAAPPAHDRIPRVSKATLKRRPSQAPSLASCPLRCPDQAPRRFSHLNRRQRARPLVPPPRTRHCQARAQERSSSPAGWRTRASRRCSSAWTAMSTCATGTSRSPRRAAPALASAAMLPSGEPRGARPSAGIARALAPCGLRKDPRSFASIAILGHLACAWRGATHVLCALFPLASAVFAGRSDKGARLLCAPAVHSARPSSYESKHSMAICPGACGVELRAWCQAARVAWIPRKAVKAGRGAWGCPGSGTRRLGHTASKQRESEGAARSSTHADSLDGGATASTGGGAQGIYSQRVRLRCPSQVHLLQRRLPLLRTHGRDQLPGLLPVPRGAAPARRRTRRGRICDPQEPKKSSACSRGPAARTRRCSAASPRAWRARAG